MSDDDFDAEAYVQGSGLIAGLSEWLDTVIAVRQRVAERGVDPRMVDRHAAFYLRKLADRLDPDL